MAERFERIRIFESTMELCGKDQTLRDSIQHSKENQKIHWQEDALPMGTVRYSDPAVLILSSKRTFEAAKQYARAGKKVCALNFASSVTPGGGVVKGASAQEESMCRISSLYAAISDQETAGAFYSRHWQMIQNGEMGRENRDDCIFTPGVEVFREDTFDCEMLPRSEWYSVDVITCAAPDLRYDTSGRTFKPTPSELTALFERRWRKILSVAAFYGAEVLILGAFGCGAFHNPPEAVVQAFNRVYPDFSFCFETIEFGVFTQTADAANYQAFSKIQGIRAASSRPEEKTEIVSPSASSIKELEASWQKLLHLIEYFNRRIKEPGWLADDKQAIYSMKDQMLKTLLLKRPPCVELTLFYVPYILYSAATKDRAGQMMRQDGNRYGFEYYLSQIPPTESDREVPEKALIELQAVCMKEQFSFHMPVELAAQCGIDWKTLSRKPWVAAPEYFHSLLAEAEPVIKSLLAQVEGR